MDALFAEVVKGIPNFVFAAMGMYLMYKQNQALLALNSRLIDLLSQRPLVEKVQAANLANPAL